ncbi:hypothetical protein G6011_09564 [Alternaria panax]|uniref:Zn(2)-C6 fungal-type domain-containing protein n=1 Tax=Alternaria panax TaxID=48097 RepID=A0AAD4FBA7_9PLEO|nr:hypothetical protein G6011_09564 [Alternaria panax]
MSNPSDSDTQHGYSHSRNEGTLQTHEHRAQQACVLCRTRKRKCDGSSPCKQCSENNKKCEYEKVPPARNDRDLKNIVRTTTETLREVRALALQQKEPSRSLGGLLVTGSLHLKSLEVDQETHKTLFSSPKLRELSEAYIGNVHILNPMFNAPRKMCDDFIEEYSDTAAERRDSITPCLHNANVLLFLALGICVTIRDGSRHPGILPGMEYYSYAQGILAREWEANSVALAQTITLAALYTNQVGRLSGQNQKTPICEETKRTAWICRDLARSINACLHIISADFVSISGSDMPPAESLEEGPEMVYATRVLLRKILNGVQKLTPTDLATAGKSDEELLEYLTNTASCQINILENWRSALPSHLAWEHKELPSTDPLRASLRAEYYSGTSTLLRPYLEIVRDCECFSATTDKPSAGQQGLIGVVHRWVQAAVASTIAFDRIV